MSTPGSRVTAARRPTRLASALAVGAALVGAWRLGASPLALGVAAVGIAAFAAGTGLVRGGRRLPGAFVSVAGIGACAAAVALAAAAVDQLSGHLRLLPAVLGVLVLGVALAPVGGTGSRELVRAGTGLVYLSTLVSAVFQTVALGGLLLAGAAAIVAWDAGEHAVSVGDHLGRRAGTTEVEVVHVAGSVGVAVLAIAAARVAGGVGLSGLSLASLALVLVAVLLLLVALHE
ncbi:DUF7519 family protein [Halomicrococcus sp. SG-WS-1]|uniref:DUF7519 family protein n=1 Tax=Halomicrococcus sp. SG-WS-1 TaxID=3439057 RepID=UPI003F7A6216